MKTSTLQNKLKKMQLFFKKSLLFEKIIISLRLDKKSSVFAMLLFLKTRHFQNLTRKNLMFANLRAYFPVKLGSRDLKNEQSKFVI